MRKKTKKITPELCNLIPMEEDPLYFLIYPIHFGMDNHIRLINWIKCLIILYMQIFNLIGIIYISKDIRSNFRRYISGILIQQFGISSYALTMYYARDISYLSRVVGKFFLHFGSTGKRANQEILHQHALTRKYFLVIFILLITAHFGFLPGISSLKNYQFTVVFIEENFDSWSCFFKTLYYFCVLSFGYSIASLCCIFLYIASHLKNQFYLLSSLLKQASHGTESIKDDTLHQEVIQERLKSFIQAHVKILHLSKKFLAIGKLSVGVSAITNSFLYTALINVIVMNINNQSNLIISLLGLTVSVLVSYLVVREGQKLQDESNNLYKAACQCKWNDWNVQNRRTLLMIMMITAKTVTFTSFGIFDLGNEIMLRMVKLAYSLMLLFLNLNN